MKTISILFLILSCTSLSFGQNQNVNLIANVNDYPNVGYSDCWGYTAPDGREYALLGVNTGVSIIDVTDRDNISEVVFVPYVTAPPYGWYDIKLYRHYMYVSSEGNESVLIVDLSSLPNSAAKVGSVTGLTSGPHNIYIDREMGILYVVEDIHYDPAVRLFSLADPVNPIQVSTIGTANFGTDCHDLFAQDSVLYIAEGENPSIAIVDVSDPANPSLLTRLMIPSAGYVHQVWVSEDNKYMVTTEETPGKTIKIWDIQNLEDIVLVGEYLDGSRLAHNAYIKNDSLYIAHYESGLKIVDISHPDDPFEVGFYDTHPASTSPQFNGAWGVYPFTQNGFIFVSDMKTGLYVLEYQQEEGPQITASINSVDFGRIEVGATDFHTIIIRNLGTENLTVNDITVSGESFSLGNMPTLPAAIPPNRSETIKVVFSPATAGSFTGSLTLRSNDANDPELEISLLGQSTQFNPAVVGICYAITGDTEENPGSLITIDLATGTGSLLGSAGLLSDVGLKGSFALAINSRGEIYASDIGVTSNIYRLDAATGAGVVVMNSGIEAIQALAFDANDVLYAASWTSDLYMIDLATGNAELIGNIGVDIRGLAFDPIDGTLWASERGDKIYTLDILTGAATLIGTAWPRYGTSDISFDPAGNLYGIIPNNGLPYRLIAINKSTGAASIIGSTGFQSVYGMAMRHPPREGPHIGFTPSALLFGTVEAGTRDTMTVSIHSNGTEELILSDISAPKPPLVLSNPPSLPVTIPPGEAITLDVTFMPTEAQTIDDSMTIVSNDNEMGIFRLKIHARSYVINPAEQGVIYAVTGTQVKGSLLTLNSESGRGSKVGRTGFDELSGVTIQPSTGQLFGTVLNENSTSIVRIDALSGEAFPLIEIPIASIRAIAFDGDTLYGANYSSGVLYQIDLQSGETRTMGQTGIDNLSGLAFDLTGELWGTGALDDAIYKINKSTGEATLVGNSGFNKTHDLAFDATGKLLALSGFPPPYLPVKLLQIDPATGIGTQIGSTRFRSVYGLAISGSVVTGVESQLAEALPVRFELHQNHPNPFNPETTIMYALPTAGRVVIKIYNMLGKEIRTLVDENQSAGYKSVVWDGKTDSGQQVSSGVYVYKLSAGGEQHFKKMLLIK